MIIVEQNMSTSYHAWMQYCAEGEKTHQLNHPLELWIIFMLPPLLRLVLSTPTCSSVHYNNFKLLNVLSRHFHREIFQSLLYSVIDLLITC